MSQRATRFRMLALLEFAGGGWEVGHGDLIAGGALLLAGAVFAWLSWGPRY